MSWGNAGKDALAGAGTGAAMGSVIPGLGTLIGGAIGGVGGALIGAFQGDGPDLNAIYGNLSPTDVQTLINAGQINGNAYDQISMDPATRAAQMQALAYMANVGNTQGMDLQSQVAEQQALNAANQNDRANREAALNQMAMRGQMNGGAALAAQLANEQISAQANSMAGAQYAADARQRALAAMAQAGQLGGQVRGQDWSQQAARAQAQNAINQWNAANARSAYEQNWNEQVQKAGGQANVQPTAYAQNIGQGAALGQLGGMGASWWQQQQKQKPQQQPTSGYDFENK